MRLVMVLISGGRGKREDGKETLTRYLQGLFKFLKTIHSLNQQIIKNLVYGSPVLGHGSRE